MAWTLNDWRAGVDDFYREVESFSQGYWDCPSCGGDWLDNCETHCPECDADLEAWGEPSFCWSSCDCCGCHLGGDRWHVIGWLKGAADGGYSGDFQWEGEVCADCLLFGANGEEPDLPEEA